MGNIGSIDMMFLDDVFGMGGGYVLNFSDRTFSEFFREELQIDIDDPLYAHNGGSKAKRLRCFLQTVDKPTVDRALKALWAYRDALQQRSRRAERTGPRPGPVPVMATRAQSGAIHGRSGHADSSCQQPARQGVGRKSSHPDILSPGFGATPLPSA